MHCEIPKRGVLLSVLLACFTLLLVPACESQLAAPSADGPLRQPGRVFSDGNFLAPAGQPPIARGVSTPPDLDSAQAQLTWNVDTGDLTWYYAHPGDYNQDGLITVNDITPLGVNFNAEGPFDMESSLSVVDGNSDGLITVNDITPIGQNFNKSVERYQAFHSNSMDDYPPSNTAANGAGATLLGTVQLKNNPLLAGKRRHFTLHLASPPASGYGWVRPLSSEYDPGTPSNLITFGSSSGNAEPVAALGANPTSGEAPLIVDFDAGGSTDSDGQIVQYGYDFDGDATIDLSTDQSSAQHTYASAGVFNASVTVLDDDGGEDSASVSITVTGGGNQPPTAQITVTPDSASPGTTVVLDGSGSSDPEGTTLHYSFDPEGDGTFHAPTTEASLDWTYTGLGEFQPALRVSDEDGLEDTAQGNLEISLGTLEHHTIDAECEPQTGNWIVSLVMSGGRPGVVYYDAGAEFDHTVRWRYPLTAACDSWGDQRGIASGDLYLSTATVLDKAAIAYSDGSDILYAISQNADGSGDWNIHVVADASEISGAGLVYPSLAVISGNPAMICLSMEALTGGSLFYNRAQEDTGNSWPTATKLIDVSTEVIGLSSLCEVYGRPAIAYTTATAFAGEIMFWRAADDYGDNWTAAPVEVLPEAYYALSDTSLRMVVNRPTLVYYNDWTDEVCYIRARDTYGVVWGDPMTIDSNTGANTSIDLLVVNGLPTIAYRKAGVGLCCAVALDNRGESWNDPVVVDAGAGVGVSVKLAEVDGHIAFAYHNTSRGNVEFAVYR
jgi:PKD repeat protein